jgi:hypothetical protein
MSVEFERNINRRVSREINRGLNRRCEEVNNVSAEFERGINRRGEREFDGEVAGVFERRFDREFDESFIQHLARFVGTTVTIFTTSGGVSGEGFTGVLILVNRSFVRVITMIGPAPGCPLGSSCTGLPTDKREITRVGSVTDIPINRIAAFVHNAI